LRSSRLTLEQFLRETARSLYQRGICGTSIRGFVRVADSVPCGEERLTQRHVNGAQAMEFLRSSLPGALLCDGKLCGPRSPVRRLVQDKRHLKLRSALFA